MYAHTSVADPTLGLIGSLNTYLSQQHTCTHTPGNSCVQQGVLFALGMLLASAPAHSLLASMEGSLAETGHWLRGQGSCGICNVVSVLLDVLLY